MVLVYRNEEAVGAVVRESGIPRKELFIITTKVWIQEAGYEKTKKAFEASLSRLTYSVVTGVYHTRCDNQNE